MEEPSAMDLPNLPPSWSRQNAAGQRRQQVAPQGRPAHVRTAPKAKIRPLRIDYAEPPQNLRRKTLRPGEINLVCVALGDQAVDSILQRKKLMMMSSRSPLAYSHEDLGSLTSLQMKAHEDYVTEHGLEDNLSYKEAVIDAFCALGSLKKAKGSGERVRTEEQLVTIWVEYKHRLIQDLEIQTQRDQK